MGANCEEKILFCTIHCRRVRFGESCRAWILSRQERRLRQSQQQRQQQVQRRDYLQHHRKGKGVWMTQRARCCKVLQTFANNDVNNVGMEVINPPSPTILRKDPSQEFDIDVR